MNAFLSPSYVPWALLALLAVSLLAAGWLRARRRSAAPARISAEESKKMMSVMEAAAAAYEAAKRERMVITTVAEGARAGADPVAWFVQSIARVVPVYRKLETGAFDKVDDAASVGTEPQSLYIRKHNYQTYIGWARSMQ
jgi:hypothetical protein